MFVQTAQGMTSDGKTLTLEGVTPSTLYVSDRPQRVVGHMATGDFVELWGEGDDSFQDDPPNAVLAFLEPGDDVPEDAVVVIEAPRVENGKLSYAIQTLEGNSSRAGRAGHAVHRPVRAAAVPGLGVWCAPARAPTRPETVLIATPTAAALFGMSAPPLSPHRLLRLARGVRTRFDAAGHVLVDAPDGAIVDLGARGYTVLAMFARPLALGEMIGQLESGECIETDFLPMVSVINMLVDEGALVPADADRGSTRGWADPVEHAACSSWSMPACSTTTAGHVIT